MAAVAGFGAVVVAVHRAGGGGGGGGGLRYTILTSRFSALARPPAFSVAPRRRAGQPERQGDEDSVYRGAEDERDPGSLSRGGHCGTGDPGCHSLARNVSMRACTLRAILMHREQKQVAGPGPGEGVAHCLELAARHRDPLRRHAESGELVGQERRDLSRPAAAEVTLHLLDDHPVGVQRPSGARQFADGVVGSVPGLSQKNQAATRRHGSAHLGESSHPVRVVRVVDHHYYAADPIDVGPARVVRRARSETAQCGRHCHRIDAESRPHADGRKGVGHVVPCRSAHRHRDLLEPGHHGARDRLPR